MRILTTLFILTGTSSLLSAQNKDIETIKSLNRDWLNSYITKDAKVLDKIFSDNFVLINPKGMKITKADALSNLANQETISVNVDSVFVRLVTRNVGILTAYTTFVLKGEGKNMTGHNCYQDVYVKKKNTWHAVSAHVTLLDIQ